MEKRSIVIVEDDKVLLGVIEVELKEKGYEVSTAQNGSDGLSVVEKVKPDLVILDLLMPEMDGMTMLEKLRSEEWGKDTPVIVLTNADGLYGIAEALQKGVLDYIVKSKWSLEDLVDKIEKKLN